MNRNQLIGTAIGKFAGYTFQGILYSKLATAISPKGVILLKSGVKIIKYTSKAYIRTDFRKETIFSDAIDAVSTAY